MLIEKANGTFNYIGVRKSGCSDLPFASNVVDGQFMLQYDGHSGYDYVGNLAVEGATILAAADGTLEIPLEDPITSENSDPGRFNSIRILHDNGYETWYLHAEEGSECLAFGIGSAESGCQIDDSNRPEPGDQVRVDAGQPIALVGNTGLGRIAECLRRDGTKISDCTEKAFHLHFEVRSDLETVLDPYLENFWISDEALAEVALSKNVGNNVRNNEKVIREFPKAFELHQNFPNPFSDFTSIKYSLPDPSHVRIEVFDILGRKVKMLVDEHVDFGHHETIWDGTSSDGTRSVNGTYFYVMTANSSGYRSSSKMILLR